VGPEPWLRVGCRLAPKLMQPICDLTIDLLDGSWTLVNGLRRGIVEAMAASMIMSSQVLNSPDLQRPMLELLLGNFNLGEA